MIKIRLKVATCVYTCSEQEVDAFLECALLLYASGMTEWAQHTQELHDPAMQCSDIGLLSMVVCLHQVSTNRHAGNNFRTSYTDG